MRDADSQRSVVAEIEDEMKSTPTFDHIAFTAPDLEQQVDRLVGAFGFLVHSRSEQFALLSDPATRFVEQQPHVPARETGETGAWMHVDLEVEEIGVERDCGIDVIDDVANGQRHFFSYPRLMFW